MQLPVTFVGLTHRDNREKCYNALKNAGNFIHLAHDMIYMTNHINLTNKKCNLTQ